MGDEGKPDESYDLRVLFQTRGQAGARVRSFFGRNFQENLPQQEGGMDRGA